jgi:hypothetical protein
MVSCTACSSVLTRSWWRIWFCSNAISSYGIWFLTISTSVMPAMRAHDAAIFSSLSLNCQRQQEGTTVELERKIKRPGSNGKQALSGKYLKHDVHERRALCAAQLHELLLVALPRQLVQPGADLPLHAPQVLAEQLALLHHDNKDQAHDRVQITAENSFRSLAEIGSHPTTASRGCCSSRAQRA